TDVEDLGFEGMQALFHTPQGNFTAKIPIPGEHNIYNALAATAVGLALGLTLEEVAAGIAAAQTIEGRMHFIHTGGVTVIDDCYNANPVSMKAGLALLSKAKGRSIAVLGDMGELGEDERSLHYQVGIFAGQQHINTIFAAGQLAQEYIRGIKETDSDCEVHYYTDRDSMTAALLTYVKPGDSVLIKASHFMEFPKVVAALCTACESAG
ncbi:MAG: UDP-N-acetylmuramoyl-tripeptide--D-alanyl-D-alanine ligase, partial [Clostridiales bacterium]|nr:UDP-N-acetylmuramoyl-tripeptide--D-alanyl-D-alanine ligase [Clostridiales bacterium]